MEESKKQERHRELHNFIMKCLKKRPLSPVQLLEKIKSYKGKKTKPIFKINTQSGLRKDHLKSMEEKKMVFPLRRRNAINPRTKKIIEKKTTIKYGKIADSKSYEISPEDFLEKVWLDYLTEAGERGKWGKGAEKNYYHVYYFATPLTYKWKTIFEEIINNKILNKFNDYFEIYYPELESGVKNTLQELYNIMQKIELFPKEKGLTKKELEKYQKWEKKNPCFLLQYFDKKDLEKIPPAPFPKEIIKKDVEEKMERGYFLDMIYSDFMAHFEKMRDIDSKIGNFLESKLGELSSDLYLLISQPEIKIINIWKLYANKKS